jgi:hypothetical protein
MSVLQTTREKPAWVGAVAVGVTLVALSAIYFEQFGRHHSVAAPLDSAFFSDDDGKTWFADDIGKFPPFNHNGKPAYRAGVFRCGSGELFVAYLERFTDRQKADIQASIAKEPDQKANWMQYPGEIRKPGESTWRGIELTSPPAELKAYQRLLAPICPDGSNATPVWPPNSNDASGN